MRDGTFKFVPMAYLQLSNHGGFEIMLDKRCETIIYRYYGKVAHHWQKVKYSNTGRPYFTCQRKRYYIDEFIAIV